MNRPHVAEAKVFLGGSCILIGLLEDGECNDAMSLEARAGRREK